MNLYEFTVRVVGCGKNPEDAWVDLLQDGTFKFGDNYYSIPEPQDIRLIEENDDEDE